MLRDASMADIAPLVDWVEIWNSRLYGKGNDAAVAFARDHELAGVAVSDAHTTVEVGVSYTALDGDPSTPEGLLAALASAEVLTGRGSYLARLVTPAAKVLQRMRGNGRVRPVAEAPP